MTALTIGRVAAETGTNAPTIRYYERIGLFPPAAHRVGNQRRYGGADVRRLTFIRRCRDFGFSIDQVRLLTAVMDNPGRSCMDARNLAQAHLDAVGAKRAELQALERSLAAFVAHCDAACAGGPGPDCAVLDELASPASNGGRAC